MGDTPTELEAWFRSFYAAFNARDADTVLAGMAPDVDWANGMSGGRVHGRDAVRAYWAHQWTLLDSRVDPVAIARTPEGLVEVDVHQVVYNASGSLIVDQFVRHVYQLRDGLVARMDIQPSAQARQGLGYASEIVAAGVDSVAFYHGTRADLRAGDLIHPGYASNYTDRRSPWVYFSATLEAATWGAELAKGEGSARIYVVQPTGGFVDDPNLTDQKFAGNPTKSYRSREPLRVLSELENWTGHAPEVIQAMKNGIAGLEPVDD